MASTSTHETEVRRVTWVGLCVNVALALLKLAAGVLGRSQAVVADGVHSLSDTGTDVAVLVGVKYWSAPADESHPHGHGRLETLVTILIGVVLAGVAVGLGWNALVSVRSPHDAPPGWIAVAAAAVSIVSKEWLYRWTARTGHRVRSSAVLANAWHHRSDALSSVPAVLAVAGARMFPDWIVLDHVGAVIVSVFILHAAGKISLPAIQELLDAGAPEEVRVAIEKIARATPGVDAVHRVRTRYVGSAIQADLHALVAPEISVRQGHDIATHVKERLLDSDLGLMDVVVHVEPRDEADETRYRDGGRA